VASGYEDALSASIQKETPIIVFFYIESDELCQKLRDNYLRNYEVYSFLDNFLNVAVNLEGNDFDRKLAKTYMKALKLDPKCKECSAELEKLKENKEKISRR